MNSFLEGLLPYLVALYLFDGFVRAWPGEVLFYSLGGRAYRLAGPGFRLALPTPESQAFAVSSGAAFIGDDAVAFTSGALRLNTPLPAAFEEEPIEGESRFHAEERYVLRGTRRLLATGSPDAARHASRLLEALRTSPAPARETVRSRWMDEAFDLSGLRDALDRYRKASASGRAGGWTLLTILFVALPLSLFSPVGRFAPPASWLLLAAGAWAYSLWGVLRLLKDCGLDRGSRVLAFLHFVFLPVSAARAWSVSSRHLFAKYDFLTVAAAVLDEAGFAGLARSELARLRSLPADCEARAVRQAIAARERRVRGLVRDALGAAEPPPPARIDGAASLYCPLCGAEFLQGAPECADCRIPLEEFPPATATVAAVPPRE